MAKSLEVLRRVVEFGNGAVTRACASMLACWWCLPLASSAAPAAAAGGGEAAGGEEKSEFDLHLTGVGDNKVNVIKAVREITGLGLKEAKDIVDAAPKVVKETLDKAAADEAMKKLTDAGATAELK